MIRRKLTRLVADPSDADFVATPRLDNRRARIAKLAAKVAPRRPPRGLPPNGEYIYVDGELRWLVRNR
jgi:hypothetical protein